MPSAVENGKQKIILVQAESEMCCSVLRCTLQSVAEKSSVWESCCSLWWGWEHEDPLVCFEKFLVYRLKKSYPHIFLLSELVTLNTVSLPWAFFSSCLLELSSRTSVLSGNLLPVFLEGWSEQWEHFQQKEGEQDCEARLDGGFQNCQVYVNLGENQTKVTITGGLVRDASNYSSPWLSLPWWHVSGRGG